MKKITCISYHETGSSAVDDYIREFRNAFFAPTDYECRFLQDPDGISDLEFNLIDNWHRLNSDYAIKRYKKFAKVNKKTYSRIFGNSWLNETKKYLDSLIEFSFNGYTHFDEKDFSIFKKALNKIKRGINKVLPKGLRKVSDYNYFPRQLSYHSFVTRDYFYQQTKEYIDRLCRSIVNNDDAFIILDQLVSTTNVSRYLNYVSDLKVIIVDRDPRDVFIQDVSSKCRVLPTDVEKFIEVYKHSRTTLPEELKNSTVIKIQFEDLVYNYEITTKTIRDFLGLKEEDHVFLKKHFNPEISKNNTKLWLKTDKYRKQIAIIEEKLKDYIVEDYK